METIGAALMALALTGMRALTSMRYTSSWLLQTSLTSALGFAIAALHRLTYASLRLMGQAAGSEAKRHMSSRRACTSSIVLASLRPRRATASASSELSHRCECCQSLTLPREHRPGSMIPARSLHLPHLLPQPARTAQGACAPFRMRPPPNSSVLDMRAWCARKCMRVCALEPDASSHRCALRPGVYPPARVTRRAGRRARAQRCPSRCSTRAHLPRARTAARAHPVRAAARRRRARRSSC